MSDIQNYTHLTKENITDAEEIREAIKDLNPFAQQLILERVRGMKDMQTLMSRKTA